MHILADLKKLNHLLPGVRHHHESLDGTGYPGGLAGDAIPLEARILAVADSFDAMSSTRPYRRRLTPMQIDEILRKGAGVQWDPRIVDALFACRVDLEHDPPEGPRREPPGRRQRHPRPILSGRRMAMPIATRCISAHLIGL